ncbi:hypothetical protein QT975_02605 [Microcoleus sp. w2-18aC4]|uniref:hypothetical protein n=1 Tax=Microcoleus sp. S36b_A4 TaxID=3055420 RepID=UPI002FD6BE85
MVYSDKNVSKLFDSNPNIVPMMNIYQFNRSECDLNYNQKGLEGVVSVDRAEG